MILGIDYGDKNIGIAISDKTFKFAVGLTTLRRTDKNAFKPIIKELNEIIKLHNISLVVLGYPKNLDNSIGERCEKTLFFKDKLHKNFKSLNVILWDERFSTKSSYNFLRKSGFNKDKIDKEIDKTAAVIILQSYLDNQNFKENFNCE